ncbi:ankyrin repeat domain-containing protein [Pseudoxanthomonas winnipegensis]|uniref:Ankyrin repeat domain-containing protein n=1 Tax=Pseudoxanthomonas winnipegensis TaxID=2480810 RepID=A0A4Q8M371_9GAMM|nr:ankyrin repeat domain-containing protein [Pseudoxanthomonas winnipegensis]TAA41551.1 ankyrin repeat domain-containing protein [Pseudoxanthomonas winnipegensis]
MDYRRISETAGAKNWQRALDLIEDEYSDNTAEFQDLLDLMLERGLDVNAKDDRSKSLLGWACACSGSAETTGYVKSLLRAGADSNTRSENTGFSVLHFAASYGRPALVEELLIFGADPNAVVEMEGAWTNGLRAVELNTGAWSDEIFNLLIEYGTDLDREIQGKTLVQRFPEIQTLPAYVAKMEAINIQAAISDLPIRRTKQRVM